MFSGGALFGTEASQGFNMGGTQAETLSWGAGTQADSAPKKPRQEAKETCLPVTIRSIQTAFRQREETGADMKFYNVAEPAMVIVVASVESVIRQAASLEVVLNDATGRIKGRYFVSDAQPELEQIVPGCYVSCFGELRAAPTQHLALKGVRLVSSADEISYHVIEVAHAALSLQKGRAAEPATPSAKKAVMEDRIESAGAAPKSDLSPQKSAANPYSVAAAVAPMDAVSAPSETAETAESPAAATSAPKAAPTGAELRATVLGLLRDNSGSLEGMHVDVIAERTGSSQSEVKKIVAELVDDGELYNTITDDHFAAV